MYRYFLIRKYVFIKIKVLFSISCIFLKLDCYLKWF